MAKKPRGLSKRQLEQWATINEAAIDFGAWLVSEPNKNPIRLECLDAMLPVYLSRIGFEVTAIGSNERLVPVGGGFGPAKVYVFQIDLASPEPAWMDAIR